MSARSGVVVALAAVAVTLAACGGGAEPPTAEVLAKALVVPEDLEGDWLPDESFAEWPDGKPGVIPEDQRGMMPTIEFCEGAGEASVAAAADLTWQAFTQLNMDLPEVSGAGAGNPGNMVAVQESLLAGDAADIEATFTALRDGVTACFGGPTESEDGSYTSAELAVGDLGDDRIASRDVLLQADGAEVAWTNNTALVRKGAVLMGVNVIEVVLGADTQPVLTEENVQAILTTIADKLP